MSTIKQIEIPEKYNNADLVKTILALIQNQINNMKRELINLIGNQERIKGEYMAREEYDVDCGIGFSSNDFRDSGSFQYNEKLISRYKDLLDYYEACRTYVELNLIDKLYPREKKDEN